MGRLPLHAVGLCLLIALAAPRAAGADDAAEVPWCEGAILFLPRPPEPPAQILLPAQCLQAATEGHRTAIAAGEAGALLVNHLDPDRPTVVLVPTVGNVTGVELRDGALTVMEALSVSRYVVVLDDGSVAAPAIPPEPVQVELPIAQVPGERVRIGEVERLSGRRAVVRRDPDGPPLLMGSLVAVHRPGIPSAVDPTSGRVRRGRQGRTRVVPIDSATDQHVVLLLGRGDVVKRGDEVLWGGSIGPATARIVSPGSWRNQLSFLLELTPGFSLSVWSPGYHVAGRLRAAWALPIPMRLEVGLEHVSLGFVPDGRPFVGGDVQVLAELDLEPFGMGISGGYQSLGLDHTGVTLGGQVRVGFRDGLHVDVRARFLVGANDPFGGVEGRGVIPFTDLVGLSLEGGGGSGQGFARLGLVVHAFGQGGPGTLLVNPGLGLQVMGWTGLADRSDVWSGTRISHVGPSVTLRIEWRP